MHESGIAESIASILGPMTVDIRPSGTAGNYYFFQLAAFFHRELCD